MTQSTEQAAEGRGAAEEYPEDRFDRLPPSNRVGAHRVTAQPRALWPYLIGGLVAFVLLTGIGIFAVHSIGQSGKLPLRNGGASTAAPAQQVQPELDPKATVAVLNGSTAPDLSAGLEQVITKNKWGTVVLSDSAETSDVTISAVFYSDEADAPAAAGLAAELGGLSTYTTEDYPEIEAQLIVLIGSDYAGPGIEEAEKIAAKAKKKEEAEPTESAEPTEQIDPATGYPIDPTTGWPIDPATGWPIDPNTGQPTDPATIPAQ
ncbi:MAG: LytR C-terminal domain-containing protein [Leucobacter sp.]